MPTIYELSSAPASHSCQSLAVIGAAAGWVRARSLWPWDGSRLWRRWREALQLGREVPVRRPTTPVRGSMGVTEVIHTALVRPDSPIVPIRVEVDFATNDICTEGTPVGCDLAVVKGYYRRSAGISPLRIEFKPVTVRLVEDVQPGEGILGARGASGIIGSACASAGHVRSAIALTAVAEEAKSVFCLAMAGVLTW